MGWYHSHPGYGCWLSGGRRRQPPGCEWRPAGRAPRLHPASAMRARAGDNSHEQLIRKARQNSAPHFFPLHLDTGIDCSTQMLNQQFQEPFLAIVVDPVRTMASGKVEVGAFRCARVRVCAACVCVSENTHTHTQTHTHTNTQTHQDIP